MNMIEYELMTSYGVYESGTNEELTLQVLLFLS